MYENYLLNPRAIAEVANLIEGFRVQPLTADEVRTVIDSRLRDPDYFCAPEKMGDAAKVDAGRILEELFNHFSETRVSYEKVGHGVALTEWLINNTPGDLREISELLAKVFRRQPRNE